MFIAQRPNAVEISGVCYEKDSTQSHEVLRQVSVYTVRASLRVVGN